jgi:BirA family biotin operon repressor/biotin-[acetyl-CoA-carboxylase] ligase
MMPASLGGEVGMLALVRLLQDGRFHSGEQLGMALGVSRSAVWKQLQQLEAELHVSVHKVRGRGYRLATPLSMLDAELLANSCFAWPVSVHDSIDSTNAEALRRLELGVEPPYLLLAERQTAGRGRRGRQWVSPYGENLYCSLVLCIEGGARQLEGLSLVVGLAVMQVLRDNGLSAAGLKWPNDLLVGGRKIAGILLELAGDPADVCHVVIGIGINVNMLTISEDIDQPWTSMRAETGKLVDRTQLALDLSLSLQKYLAIHARSGFAALRDQWEAAHLWQGQAVSLMTATQRVDGVVLGVDQAGALRMRVNGAEQKYNGGELSLRLRDDS